MQMRFPGVSGRWFTAGMIAALCAGTATPLVAQSGGGYDLTWTVVAGGGGKSRDGTGLYSLQGTIGQPTVGTMTGSTYSLTGGFWAVPAAIAGDIDGDGHVDVIDLLYLIQGFGTLEGGPGFEPWDDLNDDGAVDVIDLLIMISTFGT